MGRLVHGGAYAVEIRIPRKVGCQAGVPDMDQVTITDQV